jgi:hypothetical protein
MRKHVVISRQAAAKHILETKEWIEKAAQTESRRANKLRRNRAKRSIVLAFQVCFRNKTSFSTSERDLTAHILTCLCHPPADDPEALRRLAASVGKFSDGISSGRMSNEEVERICEEIEASGFSFGAWMWAPHV